MIAATGPFFDQPQLGDGRSEKGADFGHAKLTAKARRQPYNLSLFLSSCALHVSLLFSFLLFFQCNVREKEEE